MSPSITGDKTALTSPSLISIQVATSPLDLIAPIEPSMLPFDAVPQAADIAQHLRGGP